MTVGPWPTASLSLRLCGHGGEPCRPYILVPVTNAEDYLRLLLLRDVNVFSDIKNPLCVLGFA